MKYDIFVSYSRSDRELVASVVRRLEARGVVVWYDANIEGGADWRDTIVQALTASDMLTIFFSEDCNASRQLKKELAVADSLGKPVVPVLIENTQPRGAYLYELADRNWIQAFPDPMARIDELVDHLAALAGKADAGPDNAMKSKIAPPPPAPGSNAPLEEREQQLDQAISEMIGGAVDAQRAAPKDARKYVGRASNPGATVRRQDFLPFKWLDLVVLVPLLAIVAALNFQTAGANTTVKLLEVSALLILVLAAYGALVFPVRYYLRRRSVSAALGNYLASTATLFGLFAGLSIFGGLSAGATMSNLWNYVGMFLLAWLGLALVAFLIYGVLAGQRAIRSFRSNIRKL